MAMAEPIPVQRKNSLPAVQEGELLPAWREPTSMLRDIDTIFDRMVRNFFGSPMTGSPWAASLGPAVDIEETPDAYVFEIDLPGVRKEDLTIEIVQNELHISGQVIEKERTGVMRHRMRRTGQFSYRIALPSDTDPDKISGSHDDGVLTVTVPRTEASRPRRIDII
jgi:HSP20 family protein